MSDVVCGTGHRPPKLGGYGPEAEAWLVAFAEEVLREQPYETTVISGMAQGWDLALAEAATRLGLPLVAAVPFEGQHWKWPRPARVRYRRLLEQAQRVHTVAPSFSKTAYQWRNEYMVDGCDTVLALWDGSSGGTANCLRYAKQVRRPVVNLWDRWLRWRDAA